MTLLKDILDYTDVTRIKVEVFKNNKEYLDDNEMLLECNALLIPLEIMIRHYELRLKREKVILKESEEYQSIKTIKARDERVIIDTFDINEALLNLKFIRNKLRYQRDYLEYSLQLQLKED